MSRVYDTGPGVEVVHRTAPFDLSDLPPPGSLGSGPFSKDHPEAPGKREDVENIDFDPTE